MVWVWLMSNIRVVAQEMGRNFYDIRCTMGQWGLFSLWLNQN